MKTTLEHLNRSDTKTFVDICGPFFEHSLWVAERTAALRPFTSLEALHEALVQTMNAATTDEKVKLICAHPELVTTRVPTITA